MGITDRFTCMWDRLLGRALADHENRLTGLETRMATLEEFRARVNDFTNLLAGEIDAIAAKQAAFQAQINDLKAQLSTGNTQAVSDALDTLAPDVERLRAVGEKLRGLAATEGAPIPEALP